MNTELQQVIRDAIVNAIPSEDECLSDEDACYNQHPVHEMSKIDGEIKRIYADLDGLVGIVVDVINTR